MTGPDSETAVTELMIPDIPTQAMRDAFDANRPPLPLAIRESLDAYARECERYGLKEPDTRLLVTRAVLESRIADALTPPPAPDRETEMTPTPTNNLAADSIEQGVLIVARPSPAPDSKRGSNG